MLRSSIIFLAILAIGSVLPGRLRAQEARTADSRIVFRTRPAEGGRIDVDSRIWRARYRLEETDAALSPEALLRRESVSFGWSPTLKDLERTDDVRLSRSRHVTFQQRFKGLPVDGRYVRINLDSEDKATMILSGYTPIDEGVAFNSSPSIRTEDAVATVRRQFAPRGGAVSEPELVVHPGGKPILAFRMIVWPSHLPSEKVVLVNAQTGAIISSREEGLSLGKRFGKHEYSSNDASGVGRETLKFPSSDTKSLSSRVFTDGSGFVYDPDPITKAGVPYGAPYSDANDATNPQLDDARTAVTLRDISTDGSGLFVLEGPHVQIVGVNQSGSTTYTPPRSPSADGFFFDRSEDGFEAVNAYYHIDKSQRYVQSLGLQDRQNLSIDVNPHGLTSDDSFYFPNRNILVFGSGGVDDAEDASVLWHEYAHALLQAASPGLLSSLEGTAFHEGWSDYWAASYARYLWETGAVARSDWERVFRWDSGDGEIWSARVLDHAGHYPEDTCSDDFSPVNCSPHNDGRLWGTVLMEIYTELGRAVTDELNLRSHAYILAPVTFRDAAEALVQADLDYFGGVHLDVLLDRLGNRGLVDPGSFRPSISHEAITWSEDLGGMVTISAEAIGVSSPIASVVVRYENSVGEEDVLVLQSVSGTSYEGDLPLPSSPDVISYFLEVTDTGNRMAFLPANAPSAVFEFGVGPDTEAPVLNHTPIVQVPLVIWPPTVDVEASDNLGIERVTVTYRIEDITGTELTQGSFDLSGINGFYSSEFPVDPGSLPPNVEVHYWIEGIDAAQIQNVTRLPATGEFDFSVTSEGMLRSFDFELPSSLVTAAGIWDRGEPTFGLLAAHSGSNVMATSRSMAYPASTGLSTLEFSRVNLESVTDALLTFWHWYDMEHDGSADPASTTAQLWDGGNIKASLDGGQSWQLLIPEIGYSGVIAQSQANPLGGEPAFGGYSYGWRQVIVPLPVGSDVRLRFDFGTDNSNSDESRSFAGWYIDDVRISTQRPEDAGFPTAIVLPPSNQVLSTEEMEPVVQAQFVDDNGVADVFIDYEYDTADGVTFGTIRMDLDPATSNVFFAAFELETAPRPSDRLTYQIRVSDHLQQVSVFPSLQTDFGIDFWLMQDSDITKRSSASGIWSRNGDGWSITQRESQSQVSSINLVPLDLPSNSTSVRLVLKHRHSLTSDLGGNVKISPYDGQSWTVLDPETGYPDVLFLEPDHPMSGEPGFASDREGVIETSFALDSWAGLQVRIRIDLATPRTAIATEAWDIFSVELNESTNSEAFDVPRSLALHPAYPNPFARTSQIGFTIEDAGPVELSLYDVLGRRVALLADGFFEPGTYERTLSADNLTAGVYIIRLISSGRKKDRLIVVAD